MDYYKSTGATVQQTAEISDIVERAFAGIRIGQCSIVTQLEPLAAHVYPKLA